MPDRKPKQIKHKPAAPGWTVGSPGGTPYRIGYMRPPKAHQFKPGQSGNPAGRPSAARRLREKGLAGILAEALESKITIRVAGRKLRVTKLEAITRRLADLAAAGDARVLKLLLDHMRKDEAHAVEAPAGPETGDGFAAADREVIAALLLRLGRAA